MRRINTLADLIEMDKIIDLKAGTKIEALREIVDLMAEKSDCISDKETVLKEIYNREKIMSTGIGLGIAVPHVKIPAIKDFVVGIGRSAKGIDFDAIDEQPVNIIVTIGASDKQAQEFLRVLAKVVLRLKSKKVRDAIINAQYPKDIRNIIVGG